MQKRLGAGSLVFITGAVAAMISLVAVYWFFVRTQTGQEIDQLAFDGAKIGHQTLAPYVLSFLHSLPLVAAIIAFVLAVVVSAVRRSWFLFALAIGSAVAANLSTQFLKFLLPRPDLGVDGFAYNSLPSGHTTVAAASVLVVFLVASPQWRGWTALAGATFTVIAGVATLAGQWHRPSDVVAALLVVAFWGCLAGALGQRPRVETTRIQVPRMRILLWVALLSTFGTALAFLFILTQPDTGETILLVAYGGGVTAITAAGFLLAALATRAFRRVR